MKHSKPKLKTAKGRDPKAANQTQPSRRLDETVTDTSLTRTNVIYPSLEQLEKLFICTRHIILDAEWSNKYEPLTHTGFGGSIPDFISLQLLGQGNDHTNQFAVQFISDRYPRPKTVTQVNCKVYAVWVTDEQVNNGLLHLCGTDRKAKITLGMYYSPVDIQMSVGLEFMKAYLLGLPNAQGVKQLNPPEKKRNFTGRFKIGKWEVTIKDYYGLFNSSLAGAITEMGIDPMGKDLTKTWTDRYSTEDFVWSKGHMETPANDNADEFLDYGLGDVFDLDTAVKRKVKYNNQTCRDAFGFDPEYTEDSVPCSSGKLVTEVWLKWFAHNYPALYTKSFELTNTSSDKLYGKVRGLRALSKDVDYQRAIKDYEGVLNGRDNAKNEIVHGLAQAAIPNFLRLNPNDTGIYGAVVHGGRCINEEHHSNPYESRIHDVVDIDLSGCYGSALSKFEFPLGIPTVTGYDVDNLNQTLGQVLDQTGKELVDGLWVMYLKGELPFNQDLLVSKYELDTAKIQRTLSGGTYTDHVEGVVLDEHSVELAHLSGDFELTKKSLNLAVLTSASWEVLTKVLSSREMSEFRKVFVQALIYYPKKLELSHDAFIAHDFGSTTRDEETQQLIDTRSRCWTRVPLAGFIDPLTATRKRYKKMMNAATVPSEKAMYNGLQGGVKLFINTTYGCTASPYFPIGNTVLANNITDKARVGVWMVSKALLTVQSITDGGMFSARSVAVLNPTRYGNRKPGMAVLADRELFKAHRTVEVVSLMPNLGFGTTIKDWLLENNTSSESEETLNTICTTHINTFWKHYNLVLDFKIECKTKNTADLAVWCNKSDYALFGTIDKSSHMTTPSGDVVNYVIKVRGAKAEFHPKKLLLMHLAYPERPYPNTSFLEEHLVGVNEFKSAKRSDHDYLPGSTLDVLSTLAFHPLNGYSHDTYENYSHTMDNIKRNKKRYTDAARELALRMYKTTLILSQPTRSFSVKDNVITSAVSPTR